MTSTDNPTNLPQDEDEAPSNLIALLGGEAVLQALVERFYDLMELEPSYAALRAAHGALLTQARQKLFLFLSGSIGVLERDQWLACMDQAMGELQIDAALRARLRASFFQTADWMRNR